MPGFLIDLDGTLYRGGARIEHAAEFIGWLRERRLPYLFVTNNSSRTPQQVAEHLRKMDIPAEADDVITTGQAAAEYIIRQGRGRNVYMIGERGLEQALREAGLTLTEDRPDFVVQGIDRQFTYRKLELAVAHIAAGAVSVLTNPDHLLPTEDGPKPGAGSIAAAIRQASGREPVLIGKPSPIVMNCAIERIGLPADEIWVIGDNLSTDIAGGKAVGCRTALVLTGITAPDNANERIRETGIAPDVIAAHLREFKEHLG